jgi:replication factor A1
MHKSKKELYELVEDILTEKEFEERISKMRIECDALLDDDTIALYIVDELGRNKINISEINDLKPGIEATIFGIIISIEESRIFKRKNGTYGKVVNLEISDDSGTCFLVLWDEDADLVINEKIKIGTNVKVVNGYVKEGMKGLEINSGRFGMIVVEPEDMPKIDCKAYKDLNKINGVIIEIYPTKPFFKESGDFGFVTNISLETDDGVKNLVLWDKKVKEIQNYKLGDRISIENFDRKSRNGSIELHVNGRAVLSSF